MCFQFHSPYIGDLGRSGFDCIKESASTKLINWLKILKYSHGSQTWKERRSSTLKEETTLQKSTNIVWNSLHITRFSFSTQLNIDHSEVFTSSCFLTFLYWLPWNLLLSLWLTPILSLALTLLWWIISHCIDNLDI